MALGLGLGLIGFGSGASSGDGGGGNTWNPADNANFVLSNGNLTASSGGVSKSQVRSITTRASGKYYFEFSWNTLSSNTGQGIGIIDSTVSIPIAAPYLGAGNNTVGLLRNGFLGFNGGFSSEWFVGSGLSGDVIAIAADLTTEKLWVAGITLGTGWFGSAAGDPAAGTNGFDFSAASVSTWAVSAFCDTSDTTGCTVNLGGSAFTGTPPSGFSAWG